MGVADAVATVAGHILARLRDDLTPAQETVLRRALHTEAERIHPAPGALARIRARIADKTAARVAPRTAEPNDWLESKDMHTLQSETTPRGRQMAAALALAHLLESGPDETAEWRIDDHGALHGHVRRPHSDADARRAVHEFAGFLGHRGAQRSQGRNDHAEWIRLCTSGTYRGVPVSVWTHVAIRSLTPFGSKA